MKKYSPKLILVSLCLASCSSVTPDAHLESMPIAITAPTAADALFTFKKSNMSPGEEDLFKRADENFKSWLMDSGIKIKYVEVETLGFDVAFKLEPVMEKEVQTLVIKYSEDAFYDHSATLNLTRFMETMFSPTTTPKVSIFDLYNNAVANDATTLLTVAKMRKLVLTPVDKSAFYSLNTSQYNGFILGESIQWERKVEEYTKLEKKVKSEKRKPAQAKNTP